MNLEEIRNKLLKEKEEIELILKDLETEERETLREVVKTPDEEADRYEAGQEFHIQKENLINRLERINKALKKIDEDTYGICEKCGKNIEEARLKIDLATPYCRNCSLKT